MRRWAQIALAALAVSALAVVPLAFGGDGRGYPRGGGGVPPNIRASAITLTGTASAARFAVTGTTASDGVSFAADTNRLSWAGGLNVDSSGGVRSNQGFNTSGGAFNAGTAGTGIQLGGRALDTNTAPTVTACSGGTAASITASNGTGTVVFDVGTACASESTAVLTLPAATVGWVCSCSTTTADKMIQQRVMPASTTQVTLQNITISTGANDDFADGADVACLCRGL